MFQTVPRMIPRSWLARCLAMTAALSMAMAQENCPADLVSFEVITGEFIFQISVNMSGIIIIIFNVRICVHCPSRHA